MQAPEPPPESMVRLLRSELPPELLGDIEEAIRAQDATRFLKLPSWPTPLWLVPLILVGAILAGRLYLYFDERDEGFFEPVVGQLTAFLFVACLVALWPVWKMALGAMARGPDGWVITPTAFVELEGPWAFVTPWRAVLEYPRREVFTTTTYLDHRTGKYSSVDPNRGELRKGPVSVAGRSTFTGAGAFLPVRDGAGVTNRELFPLGRTPEDFEAFLGGLTSRISAAPEAPARALPPARFVPPWPLELAVVGLVAFGLAVALRTSWVGPAIDRSRVQSALRACLSGHCDAFDAERLLTRRGHLLGADLAPLQRRWRELRDDSVGENRGHLLRYPKHDFHYDQLVKTLEQIHSLAPDPAFTTELELLRSPGEEWRGWAVAELRRRLQRAANGEKSGFLFFSLHARDPEQKMFLDLREGGALTSLIAEGETRQTRVEKPITADAVSRLFAAVLAEELWSVRPTDQGEESTGSLSAVTSGVQGFRVTLLEAAGSTDGRVRRLALVCNELLGPAN